VNRPPSPERRERGQVLVVFALALVVIVAMVGLVLDGGSTYAQRRDMQNVADAAAMAGAYAYTNTYVTSPGTAPNAAFVAAESIATANGYTNGVNGVTISVTIGSLNGATTVQVDLGKPHQNSFAGVMGMSSWGVATTATAETGAPNSATGAMPVIFNQNSVTNSTSNQTFGEPGTGTEDVPQTPTTFNWTVYCTANGNPCNGDSNTVDNLINGSGTNTTVNLKELIGPLNAGSHTTLFSDLAAHVGQDLAVAIVNNDGAMVGWAMFHLTGSVGGSTKQISGYFVSPTNNSALSITNNGGNGTSQFGTYTVRLVN